MKKSRKEKKSGNHRGLMLFMPVLAGLYGFSISLVGGIMLMGRRTVSKELTVMGFEIAAIVFSVFLIFRVMPRKFPQMKSYSLRKPNLYCILATILLMPAFIAIENAIVYLVSFKWAALEFNTISYNGEELKEDLLSSVSAVFLAPIYEEFSFRVMPLSVYKKKGTRIVVAVIMGAIFAWLHADNWMVVLMDSALFATLFLKTKNAWVNICAHSCNNLYVTILAILAFFGIEGKMTEGAPLILIPPTPVLIVSAVMAVAGVAVIIYGRRKSVEKTEQSGIVNEQAIHDFIRNNARPVDLAEYNYFFGNGSKEDVITALLEFRNSDGGFGKCLEADCWNPNSSPIATNDAILKLSRIDALEQNLPIVCDAVRYLKSGDSFNSEKKKWQFAIESNKDYPHAIWWEIEEGKDGITDFNPTVSLATFLVCYSDDDGYYADIVKDAFEFLINAEKMGSDDIKCYQHAYYMLVKTGHTDIVDLEAARKAIVHLIDCTISRDVTKYGREYVATPSDFFVGESWEIFYNSSFDELINAEADNLVNIQQTDGGFDIYWQWYTDYPEFAEARKIWRPRVSLEKLLFLSGAGKRNNRE